MWGRGSAGAIRDAVTRATGVQKKEGPKALAQGRAGAGDPCAAGGAVPRAKREQAACTRNENSTKTRVCVSLKSEEQQTAGFA